MNNLDNMDTGKGMDETTKLIVLGAAALALSVYPIKSHIDDNHPHVYAYADVKAELERDGINKAKQKLNKEIIGKNNLETRIKLYDCIGKALADCSPNVQAAARDGLEQYYSYKLDSADVECIKDERRQEALKACAQLVEISQ